MKYLLNIINKKYYFYFLLYLQILQGFRERSRIAWLFFLPTETRSFTSYFKNYNLLFNWLIFSVNIETSDSVRLTNIIQIETTKKFVENTLGYFNFSIKEPHFISLEKIKRSDFFGKLFRTGCIHVNINNYLRRNSSVSRISKKNIFHWHRFRNSRQPV